ncbi:MAG: DUF1800 family protein [Saprospiraceae bacterium]
MVTKRTLIVVLAIWQYIYLIAQPDTLILGYGGYSGVSISASSNVGPGSSENTMNQDGFIPNENAASRFLSQATLGYDYSDIISVTEAGIEAWIENQLTIPRSFTLESKIRQYHKMVKDSTNTPTAGAGNRLWDYAWWQYLMTSQDDLRQRVALALSEMLVISENSAFNNNAYAMGVYYDKLLNHSFGNYRNLLRDVTYNPSMGIYLTYLNNPKANPALNQYPDENYSRELMQLFTIGTVMLNNDGSIILDDNGLPVPSYDNEDIIELSKIFTGLTWADRTQWNRGALNDTSYIADMVMWNTWHEPGVKNLLNGFVVPNRNPVNGVADINDALDNLFNHQNTPPFVCRFLIQRLVTSNPSPAFINRVVNVFINNGQGVRGDLAAVVKAILLDPEAKSCESGENVEFGMLREPFIRYVQINKAFNASTLSGNYRNDMSYIYQYTGQRPLTSPSVFNFFQQDYQPIGAVEEAGLVAPEFQITDAQTIAGFINGLYRWVINGDIADEYDLFSNEADANYTDEISVIDVSGETTYTDNDKLHILMDRLNLLLAQGRVSDTSLNTIINVLKEFPNTTVTEKQDRTKLAIYLFMTSPEYLINR